MRPRFHRCKCIGLLMSSDIDKWLQENGWTEVFIAAIKIFEIEKSEKRIKTIEGYTKDECKIEKESFSKMGYNTGKIWKEAG